MTGFFWGILVGLCLTYWVGYKQKQEFLSFMHFGNRTKDIIYIFETKPTYRFRYISPSLDDYLGEGTVAKSYEDAQECFRRIHPDDFMRSYSRQSSMRQRFNYRKRSRVIVPTRKLRSLSDWHGNRLPYRSRRCGMRPTRRCIKQNDK